jgi:SAM-dependent methyltransferase
MSKKRRKPVGWCEPDPDGDALDRFYAQELSAAGYGDERPRTISEAQCAWGIYERPWSTEDDLRAKSDALARYWLPYIYSNQIHGSTIRELLSIVDHLCPTRVLDLGCGVGFDACFVASQCPSLSVRGTDISPHVIDVATSRASRLRLGNCRFEVAAHRDLPRVFPTERFDLVYAHGSLIFRGVDHLYGHLSGVAQVLAPHGVFFCEMPMSINPHAFVHVVRQLELGLELWVEQRAEVRMLHVDGTPVCWCCGFRRVDGDDF